MENFDWTAFTIRILVKADLPALYDAWTKPSEIEKWFLKNAVFYNAGREIDKENSIKEGFTYEWKWYLYDDLEKGRINVANGKDFLQFTFAGECLVDVELSLQEEYVEVKLTQKNIPTDDRNKQYTRLGCHGGWSFYLINLKSVYEGGLDLRNKDTRFKPMLNN
uniref:SRPBCC family protein n=1 Tax=Pedobacter schmidteae TaxID=2201271 RepID=UPI000EB080AF|nr:SRPBCC domain-containing protein [Pedobacter schmidteae]